jgi:hypothetical protein
MIFGNNLFSIEELNHAEKAALEWLKIAHYKTGEIGFAHHKNLYYPSFLAWHKNYPETSGYIIENFLFYNNTKDNEQVRIARNTVEWLCNNHNGQGSFYRSTKKNELSSFNTAQILFGFWNAYLYFKDEKYIENYKLSNQFLLKQILPDGKWSTGLYVENYFPAYYTRAIWPMLLNIDSLSSDDILKIESSINYLFKLKNLKFFNDSGFFKEGNSLSHTVAYTLEGFYESAKILQRQDILDHVLKCMEYICDDTEEKKYLAGEFSNQLKQTASFQCMTGNFQIASLLLKIHNQNYNLRFFKIAEHLLAEGLKTQFKSNSKETNGGFPASLPIYGKYFPFKMVNWTNKFFLDACYQYKLSFKIN